MAETTEIAIFKWKEIRKTIYKNDGGSQEGETVAENARKELERKIKLHLQ